MAFSALTGIGLVDVAIAFAVLELLVLVVLRTLRVDMPALADLLPGLAAGLCLMLALRLSQPAADLALALLLALAGLAHGVDLWRRMRRMRRVPAGAASAASAVAEARHEHWSNDGRS